MASNRKLGLTEPWGINRPIPRRENKQVKQAPETTRTLHHLVQRAVS